MEKRDLVVLEMTMNIRNLMSIYLYISLSCLLGNFLWSSPPFNIKTLFILATRFAQNLLNQNLKTISCFNRTRPMADVLRTDRPRVALLCQPSEPKFFGQPAFRRIKMCPGHMVIEQFLQFLPKRRITHKIKTNDFRTESTHRMIFLPMMFLS
jgi:hypothetical protein